jgi:hypothetical protein
MKATLWLTVMNVLWVSEGKSEGQLIAEQEKTYGEANVIFVSTMIGELTNCLKDVYIHYKTTKGMWDILNDDYGGSDARTAYISWSSTTTIRWLIYRKNVVSRSDLLRSCTPGTEGRQLWPNKSGYDPVTYSSIWLGNQMRHTRTNPRAGPIPIPFLLRLNTHTRDPR